MYMRSDKYTMFDKCNICLIFSATWKGDLYLTYAYQSLLLGKALCCAYMPFGFLLNICLELIAIGKGFLFIIHMLNIWDYPTYILKKLNLQANMGDWYRVL